MKWNNYRLTENILLKVVESANLLNFYKLTESDNVQYLATNSGDIGERYAGVNLENTTFNFGLHKEKINKVFSSYLLTGLDEFETEEVRLTRCSMLLRQGFNWKDVFGINIVIKEVGVTTNNILISQIFTLDDFRVDYDTSKELINGTFYTANVNFVIPNFYKDLSVSVEIVKFSDVDLVTQIVNIYPKNVSDYEPLISSLPKSTNLDLNVSITDDQYINVEMVTDELNKTVEQSVLEYFDKNYLALVSVDYIIKYGVIGNYKSVRISNEDYKYGKLKLSLDFTEFGSETATQIFVSCSVVVDGLLMTINKEIVFDYGNSLSPIIGNIIANPNTIFPVTVENINQISQTIINQNTEQKFIPIMQTVFCQINVGEDFVFEAKNISFTNITPAKIKNALLIINNEKFINSETTLDGVMFFNLNSIEPIRAESSYIIVDLKTNILLQKGKVLI